MEFDTLRMQEVRPTLKVWAFENMGTMAHNVVEMKMCSVARVTQMDQGPLFGYGDIVESKTKAYLYI